MNYTLICCRVGTDSIDLVPVGEGEGETWAGLDESGTPLIEYAERVPPRRKPTQTYTLILDCDEETEAPEAEAVTAADDGATTPGEHGSAL